MAEKYEEKVDAVGGLLAPLRILQSRPRSSPDCPSADILVPLNLLAFAFHTVACVGVLVWRTAVMPVVPHKITPDKESKLRRYLRT